MSDDQIKLQMRKRLEELEAKIEAGLPELRKICNASDYELLMLSLELAQLSEEELAVANAHASDVMKMDNRKPVYTDWLLAVEKAKESAL